MGAQPAHAYVQLGVPDDVADESLLELADGMGALAAATAVAIAGGDVTRSPALFLALTVVGTTPTAGDAVTRSGARPGDVLAVTGELGGAAAGLILLQEPGVADDLDPEVAAGLRRRQLEPVPRLAAGRELARAGARAMIDLSDGLAGDAGHVARASGVGLRIDVDALPVAAGVEHVARATGRDPREVTVSGGEDYELLVALPAGRQEPAAAALRPLGLGLAVIGEAFAGEAVEFSSHGAEFRPAAGFDQLRPPPGPGDRA